MSNKKKTKRESILSYSMTGYGKSAYSGKDLNIEMEIRTLNSRYLDMNLKLPREFSIYEFAIREELAKHLRRGRLDLILNFSSNGSLSSELIFNPKLCADLLKLSCEQAKKLRVYNQEFAQKSLLQVLSRRDVLEIREKPIAEVLEKKMIFKLLSQAIKALLQTRAREGSRLLKDITQRLRKIALIRAAILKRSAANSAVIRESLIKKVSTLAEDINVDRTRLEFEVAMLASRSDITEELVRLESHLKTFKKELSSRAEGKKLDFLLQEILREFNTIASKAADSDVAAKVVSAKTEIERIKEQVQNIE